MIPIEKVQDIIAKYDNLEQELSSGKINAKLFANKSKEYSNLKNIINYAREFINFDSEIKDLEQIIQDKNSDLEMIEMAEKELKDPPLTVISPTAKFVVASLLVKVNVSVASFVVEPLDTALPLAAAVIAIVGAVPS